MVKKVDGLTFTFTFTWCVVFRRRLSPSLSLPHARRWQALPVNLLRLRIETSWSLLRTSFDGSGDGGGILTDYFRDYFLFIILANRFILLCAAPRRLFLCVALLFTSASCSDRPIWAVVLFYTNELDFWIELVDRGPCYTVCLLLQVTWKNGGFWLVRRLT